MSMLKSVVALLVAGLLSFGVYAGASLIAYNIDSWLIVRMIFGLISCVALIIFWLIFFGWPILLLFMTFSSVFQADTTTEAAESE